MEGWGEKKKKGRKVELYNINIMWCLSFLSFCLFPLPSVRPSDRGPARGVVFFTFFLFTWYLFISSFCKTKNYDNSFLIHFLWPNNASLVTLHT